MGRTRTVGSVRAELIAKSREAALSAIKIFNDPQLAFKSETYIVLMVIAWTYLLHAYYRGEDVEYRYFHQGPKRKVFDRTKQGSYKYWELDRCLSDKKSPVDPDAALNLRFLIGLRHEIEHQMTQDLDGYLSGRYQACAINYNDHVKRLFGNRHGVDQQMAYSIQFLELSSEQVAGPRPEATIPKGIRAYIADFDGGLTHDEYNSSGYSYRLLFKRKLVNRPNQADRVIEFIDESSDLAKTIDKEYWVKKEVERPKYRATEVVQKIQDAGYSRFRINPEHVAMWKAEDGKNPGKGYGVEIQGTWYWYQSWVERCLELCSGAPENYK
jgi:hypothetical protein